MYCPSCGSEYREGYTECADCKVPLVPLAPGDAPQRRRLPRFPTIPKPEDSRPPLLRIVPVLLVLWGGAVLLGMLAALSGLVTLTIAGKVVSGNEALVPAIVNIVLALASFAVTLAILKELPWSRPLMIACLILVAVGQLWSGSWERSSVGLGFVTLNMNIPSGVLVLPFAWWYLYAKSNVKAYYRDLKASHGSEPMSEQRPDPI